jgi:hypothetical protein
MKRVGRPNGAPCRRAIPRHKLDEPSSTAFSQVAPRRNAADSYPCALDHSVFEPMGEPGVTIRDWSRSLARFSRRHRQGSRQPDGHHSVRAARDHPWERSRNANGNPHAAGGLRHRARSLQRSVNGRCNMLPERHAGGAGRVGWRRRFRTRLSDSHQVPLGYFFRLERPLVHKWDPDWLVRIGLGGRHLCVAPALDVRLAIRNQGVLGRRGVALVTRHGSRIPKPGSASSERPDSERSRPRRSPPPVLDNVIPVHPRPDHGIPVSVTDASKPLPSWPLSGHGSPRHRRARD